MAGKIVVAEIVSDATSSNLIKIGSGATLDLAGSSGSTVLPTIPSSKMPAGAVIQTLMNIDSTELTLATATYTDTGLTITITPTTTSSKILCHWNMQAQLPDDSGIGVQLVRAISGGATTNVYTSGSNADIFQWTSGVYTKLRGGWMYLDSPSTTSATTYNIQVSSNGGTTIYLNRSSNQTQLLVQEIAG